MTICLDHPIGPIGPWDVFHWTDIWSFPLILKNSPIASYYTVLPFYMSLTNVFTGGGKAEYVSPQSCIMVCFAIAKPARGSSLELSLTIGRDL